MADVLHRTTGEFRKSVNTPDYDPAEWLINPDLKAVAGVEPKYWKQAGGRVVPMDDRERTELDRAEELAGKEAATAAAREDLAGDQRFAVLLMLINDLRGIEGLKAVTADEALELHAEAVRDK